MTAALAHVLELQALRDAEFRESEAKAAALRHEKRQQEKALFEQRFHADRQETSQRPAGVASRAATVPFGGSGPKTYSDVGVDLNKGGGG